MRQEGCTKKMKRVMKGLLIAVGLLTMGSSVFAQDHDRDWDQERMRREYRNAFYDRLQQDLSRAEHRGYLRGDDFRRFDVAHREVGEFQAKWDRGIFDAREMDRAIGSVQRVAEISSLRPEDRDFLREDLRRMREFRAHMEGRRY